MRIRLDGAGIDVSGHELDYDVDIAWPAETVADLDICLRAVLTPAHHVFHGAHRDWVTIKSSLDLEFEKYPSLAEKHKLETQLLERFGGQCFRHLQPGARMHIELARLRWNKYRTTGTMFVARHYGLPTRAVDWTPEALVALFFACRRAPDEDGVIWCMDRIQFETCLAQQWLPAYEKTGHIEDDFERDFGNGVEKGVLVQLYFPPSMQRAAAQKAFITIADQFGTDHARRIRSLGVTGCKRLVIPAGLKQPLIEKLDLMGVNGYTLGIGDSTVETIGTDIAGSLFA